MNNKEMKITPLKCALSDRQTSKGGKIYSLVFQPAGVDMEMTAVTFSDTIAQEFEKQLKNSVDAVFSVREYNGSPSYTLNEIAGVKNSGFKRGSGYQKDVVSEERKIAAMCASTLMGYSDISSLSKKKNGIQKEWEAAADYVYTWISKRPSEPVAAGGKTEQKVSDEPPLEVPPEFR